MVRELGTQLGPEWKYQGTSALSSANHTAKHTMIVSKLPFVQQDIDSDSASRKDLKGGHMGGHHKVPGMREHRLTKGSWSPAAVLEAEVLCPQVGGSGAVSLLAVPVD
jgi:hypothetical protein